MSTPTPGGCACSAPAPLPRKRTAYIALGSNLGDRVGWLEKACAEMERRGIVVKRTSCLYETAPMYVVDQERFVNGACEVCFFSLQATIQSRFY